MLSMKEIKGEVIVKGSVYGEVIGSEEKLSFWGGYDPDTGIVIDRRHPLSGQSLINKILAIPSGKGSSTGSTVFLDALYSNHAPAGLIMTRADEIISLGIIISEMLLGKSIPVVVVSAEDFSAILSAREAKIYEDGRVELLESKIQQKECWN